MRRTWGAVYRFIHRRGLIITVAILFLASYVAYDSATDATDQNRRTLVVVCENQGTLAKLVEVSVSSQATFGEGLPPDALTPFDVRVLSSIAKVQKLAAADDSSEQARVFAKALDDLTDNDACSDIAGPNPWRPVARSAPPPGNTRRRSAT
jgi:hypothetical protein